MLKFSEGKLAGELYSSGVDDLLHTGWPIQIKLSFLNSLAYEDPIAEDSDEDGLYVNELNWFVNLTGADNSGNYYLIG